MRENLKNRRNPSHQISENFGKSRNFVIFWYFGFFKVYFVFWYFGCISYFNFEIFKNPQPALLLVSSSALPAGRPASGIRMWNSLPPLKLWKARSRLYRRRFLQPNTNFSAFLEIYKMYVPLHRSDLKSPAKKSSQFSLKWFNSKCISFEFSQIWH